jgi:two-component system cell cycle sensor histidine kinase/response regulator CckA
MLHGYQDLASAAELDILGLMPHSVHEAPVTAAPPARRLTVLIVDDEHDVRSLVANVLTEYGYKTITASSAAKAVALLNKMATPPDLLLTDVVMPGNSGPMLAEELLSRFGAARVLFMSGYVERQVVQKYVVDKGFPLITKPFQLHNLCAAVKKALESQPAVAEPPAALQTTLQTM